MNKSDVEVRFALALKVHNYAPSTQRTYNLCFERFMDFLGPEITDYQQLSLLDVHKYLASLLEKGMAVRTYNQYVYMLRLFYKDVLERIVDNSQIPKLKAPETQKPCFTGDQMRQMIWECPDLRLQAIITLTFACGLRACEVANLQVKDIYKKRRKIYVHNSKGNKSRLIPYSENTEKIMHHYVEVNDLHTSDPEAYIFGTKKSGEPMEPSSFTTKFTEYIQTLPFYLPGHSFHSIPFVMPLPRNWQ